MKGIGVLLLILMSAGAGAAPAPLPKPSRPIPSPVPRYCVLMWHGSAWDARFDPDGTYYAAGTTYSYEGGWSFVGGMITVRERLVGGEGPYLLVWTFSAPSREGPIYVHPHVNRKME